jgi:transcriptional regulator with XRE-family HTH domain
LKKLDTPTADVLRALRRAACISQSKAAAMVHLSSGTRWSEYERGTKKIDAARFELFLFKTGLHPEYQPLKAKQ